MKMSNKIEVWFLVLVLIVATISTIGTILGFGFNSYDLVIQSSRWLAIASLILLTKLGYMIYEDTVGSHKEIAVTIKSREDIEEFRKQINEEIEKMLKQIDDEEKEDTLNS